MSERYPTACRSEPFPAAMDGDVVEVPLLLPGWQVSALARAAHDRGLTAGEMVRSLLCDFIHHWQHHHPDADLVAANDPE